MCVCVGVCVRVWGVGGWVFVNVGVGGSMCMCIYILLITSEVFITMHEFL